MDLRELVKADLEYQEKMKRKYEKEVKALPKGSLYAREKRGVKEFYYVEKKTRKRTYISKRNLDRLDKVKKSKQYSVCLKRIEENIKVEQLFLRKYQSINMYEINEELPAVYRLVEDLVSKPNCMKKQQNLIRFDGTVMHTTISGLNVRSKSEVLIADRLTAEGIEFEYEKELILLDSDGKFKKVLPDFSFPSAKGEEFYWEHFGLLKDPHYRRKAFDKLMLYAQNGILPGVNLFITADSLDGGIDVSSIYNTIKLLKTLI